MDTVIATAPALGSLAGIDGVVRELVPRWLVPVFRAVTALGNVGVFVFVFALDYWFVDRERGAHAMGVVIAGMAFITALKYAFAVPRPPSEVAVVTATGYSFPSGHATGAAIAYGALAADLRVGSRKLRFTVAAVLTALIALSRVVLGVHYVRDVVVGVALGAGFLLLALAITGRSARLGFLLSVAVGVVALVVSTVSQDSVVILGGALGATAAWETLDEIPSVDRLGSQAVVLGVTVPVFAVLAYLSIRTALPLAVTFVLSAVLLAGIVATPLVAYPVERVRGRGPADSD